MNRKKTGFDGQGDKGRKHSSISELYPDIEKIALFLAVEEADWESEPNYQQIIFIPETEAAFQLECSREECVVGGFDFAPVVDEMVKNGKTRVQSSLECGGTLGPLGPRCSLKAEYRIIIDWRDDNNRHKQRR